jgi:hypothetical protein
VKSVEALTEAVAVKTTLGLAGSQMILPAAGVEIVWLVNRWMISWRERVAEDPLMIWMVITSPATVTAFASGVALPELESTILVTAFGPVPVLVARKRRPF